MGIKDIFFKGSGMSEAEFLERVENRKGILYKTAFLYVRNKEDALDILHEAIYKAYLSYGKLQNPQYFNTWITRILMNCSVDHLNRNKKLLDATNRLVKEQDGQHLNRDEMLDIYDAVDKLDEKQREIVILKYFNDLTLSEISEILDCPIGTVKSHLHKALGVLRIELMEECINGA